MASNTAIETQHHDEVEASLTSPHMKRILASSFLGSVIEYYDFVLYATASAVVFTKIFFTNMDPAVAAFASFGTLATGYLSRPLGGVIFGHFGDKIGRKAMLVISMMMMGCSTLGIGLLPTAEAIGVAAPVLLILLRIVQGLAVGGEWGGAMLIALEQAPGGKRGFAASFANMGAPAGASLASLTLALMTMMPDGAFLSWGWRVPFIISVGLVALGMVIRLKVHESPLFQHFQEEADRRRIPFVDVFTHSFKGLVFGVLGALGMFTMSGMVTVWAVNASVQAGADKTGVLYVKAAAALIMVITTLVSAMASDRFGRKKVLIFGSIVGIVGVWPILHFISLGTVAGFAGAVITGQLAQGIMYGAVGAFIAELFPTAVRYTGASLAYQIASTLGAGLSPMVAASLVALSGGFWLLGATWVGVLAIAAIGVVAAREGRERELSEI